ncbi:uncharacterized protein [Hetaerina americana]
MVDIVDMKIEPQEIPEFRPEVVNVSSIQPEQEEDMVTDDDVSIEMEGMACSPETGVTDAQNNAATEGNVADFWRGTEAALEIKIPKYLRNILKVNGCDNGLSMAEFDASTQVPVLEKFVREDMSHVIPLDCFKEDYYGVFERCPERFRIVDGHVNILMRMAEYWKEIRNRPTVLQKRNNCQFSNDVSINPQSVGTQVKTDCDKERAKTTSLYDVNSLTEAYETVPRENICSISVGAESNLEEPMENTLDIEKDKTNVDTGLYHLKKEKDHIIKMIKEILKEKMVEHHEDLKSNINDFQKSNVKTKFRLMADVQCFLCSVSIRTYKSGNEFNMSKWVVSNYIRHVVEQHFKGSKKTRRKSVSPTETNTTSAFNKSTQDTQNLTLIGENLLGNPDLEDYCEEDNQIEGGLLYDETPSKKKRAQYKLGVDCEV